MAGKSVARVGSEPGLVGQSGGRNTDYTALHRLLHRGME